MFLSLASNIKAQNINTGKRPQKITSHKKRMQKSKFGFEEFFVH